MLERPLNPKLDILLPLFGYATILAFYLFAYWQMGGASARAGLLSMRPPNGRSAFQFFLSGISQHERGIVPQEACRDENAGDGLFCEEGYFFSVYSHRLLEATWKQKDPKHPVPIEIVDADAPIKLVALGMAAVQKSIPPSGLRLLDNGYEKYLFDGYGAGRRLVLGRSKTNIEDICPGMRYKKYCEFGAGRMSYFLGFPPGNAKEHPEYVMGQEFAAVTSGDVVPSNPTQIQRVALAWRNRGSASEAKKAYLCASKKGNHMIDCVSP